MNTLNYPKSAAYRLAQQMRTFLARTEETAHSEINPRAEQDRVEVVRTIDWVSFSNIIDQLEYPYLKDRKSINQIKKEAGEHLLDEEYWNEPY